MNSSPPMPQIQLNTVDKTMTAASWVATGALFLTVGWIAMAPDDPQGVVSMFARRGSLAMLRPLKALMVALQFRHRRHTFDGAGEERAEAE